MLDDLPVAFPKGVYHPPCWKPTRRPYETKNGRLTVHLGVDGPQDSRYPGTAARLRIARRAEQITGDLLAVNQGTLYPVLLKLEQEGAAPQRIIAGRASID